MNTLVTYLTWGFIVFFGILIVILFLAWMSPLVLVPIEAFVERCKKNHESKQKKAVK
jgi:hypothetical protein